MAPAASAISLTRGERCVLRQGDMSLREAAAVCADEVDASSDLEKRRCAIHTQMHSACMDTNVSSQTVFWHGRSESGPHLSTGDSFARLAERGFSAVYFWGDSTAVADVHHLLCELLRAGFDVGERDAAAVGADLRRRIGDAPLENATKLHHWIRLPFRTLEACRDGRCIELHAMRIFRVSELPPALMGAYLRATLEASTRRSQCSIARASRHSSACAAPASVYKPQGRDPPSSTRTGCGS